MAKEPMHGPHFLVHREGNGTCGSGSNSTLISSTKRRMLQSSMLLTRLFSGLFRPEDQLPVSLAPQGTGASVKLIPWEGSILV
jgi:hypothetical protein